MRSGAILKLNFLTVVCSSSNVCEEVVCFGDFHSFVCDERGCSVLWYGWMLAPKRVVDATARVVSCRPADLLAPMSGLLAVVRLRVAECGTWWSRSNCLCQSLSGQYIRNSCRRRLTAGRRRQFLPWAHRLSFFSNIPCELNR